MPSEDYFDRLRAGFPGGTLIDAAFDETLPPLLRSKSARYWTPLAVASRAAELFAAHGCSRILDVGSGPGKFCIAAAFKQPALRFCGVEQHTALVDTANGLLRSMLLCNVEFRLGDALALSWYGFDGFYFFNPFAENCLTHASRFKPRARLRSELSRLLDRLSRLRVGVLLVTYHGIGGPIPSSYDLLAEEALGSGQLRVWQKTRAVGQDFVYLEQNSGVTRLAPDDLSRLTY
jgi:SAM-dependent methyltransferase